MVFTVNALEAAAWRNVDVVAVRTVELHSVQTGQVGAATGYDVAAVAVDARTGAEHALVVLLRLIWVLVLWRDI